MCLAETLSQTETGSGARAWLPVTTLPVPVTVCAASTRVSKRPCAEKQLQRPSTVHRCFAPWRPQAQRAQSREG